MIMQSVLFGAVKAWSNADDGSSSINSIFPRCKNRYSENYFKFSLPYTSSTTSQFKAVSLHSQFVLMELSHRQLS